MNHLLIMVILSFQGILIDLQPCVANPVDLIVVHGVRPCICLGLWQLVQEGQHVTGKAGLPGLEAWATSGV